MIETMEPVRAARPALCDFHPAQGRLAEQVLSGLRQPQKQISPMYLYDERGSELFELICELPEYYPTRTEIEILKTRGDEISRCIGAHVLLVELGSGASRKTRLVLDRLVSPAAYVPVDISRNHLLAAARAICDSYPHLEVLPVCADFTRTFPLPRPTRAPARVAVFFPGSTIGNFDRTAATQLLRVMRSIAGPRGGLVIGVDLIKDPAILTRAYDDAAGITAAFNLNVLRRLNREFGADFDLTSFRHSAVWNPHESRVEMHLVSERPQTVSIAGETVELGEAERIVTEHCHKYTRESFLKIAEAAGWRGQRMWTDERAQFGVHYLC